jgi:predicted amidophosphoribosyltransferase
MGTWLVGQEAFAAEHYDIVVPIPQHWLRRLTLRYNHAEVLAGRIGQAIGQKMEQRRLRRVRWTQKQGMKSISERIANLHGAFECSPHAALRGARVLLVDDVMTSGATLDQAAKALKGRGVLQVDAVVFARGIGVPRRSNRDAQSREPGNCGWSVASS